MGEWVLMQACAEAAQWSSDKNVAVNVSAVQLKSRNFPGTVAASLSRSRLSPERLELEITETALLEHNEAILSALNELHSIGVRVASDDFAPVPQLLPVRPLRL